VPPATKARFAQSIIEEVSRLPAHRRDAIRSRCGTAWDKIEQAPPISWIDEVTYNTLTDSIRSQLGDDGTRSLYRALGRRIIHNPSFQNLVESVIRLLGMSPHTLLKATPRGRDSVVRDSGTLTYEYVGPRAARLVLRDFPVSTYKSGTTAVLLSGTFLGLLDAAGMQRSAKIELTNVNLQAGHTTFNLSW
jgi:hypothetical protein